jgi:hypothetical protein
MPVRGEDHVTHPDNRAYLERVTPRGYHLCYTCLLCKHIIPTLMLDVIMVFHRCHDRDFNIVTIANTSRAVLYKCVRQRAT